MKILLVSNMDNGQQMQLLAEALRKYTDHDALHLNQIRTFLDYDTDLWIGDFANNFEGVKRRTEGYDDFFIFSEIIPDELSLMMPKGLRKNLTSLDVFKKLTKHNTIIRMAGSLSRMSYKERYYAQLKRGWVYAGGYHDFSIASQVGLVAPTRNICPIDKIPEPTPPKDKIRICFSYTKWGKGGDEFTNVMNILTEEYDNVEPVLIKGKSWRETIEIKSTCNINFGHIKRPSKVSAPIEKVYKILTYANSPIESMWLKQPVVSKVDLWTRTLYPDLPIIVIRSEKELYDALKELIEHPEVMNEIGAKGKEFVTKYHHPKVVAEQWDKLMQFVKEAEWA